MSVTVKNCAADVVALLNGSTVGGTLLVEGENLFARPCPDAATLVVEVINSGGSPPTPFINPADTAYFQASVQLLVHTAPGSDGFAQGEALARGLLGALQQIGTELTGYITALFRESAPSYLGTDPDTGANFWSLNLDVTYVS